MRIKELDRTAVLASVSVACRVDADDLGRATPCGGWTVADLLTHMSVQHRGFAAAARGEAAQWAHGAPADDPVAGYLSASGEVLMAFRHPGREFLLTELSEQPFPADRAIGFHFIDYVVHCWDLARAIDVEVPLGEPVLAPALELALQVPGGEARTRPGALFRPAVPAGGEALLDRIVARLGRPPTWPN